MYLRYDVVVLDWEYLILQSITDFNQLHLSEEDRRQH